MAERQDDFENTRMTLGEHLEELRRRLIIGLVAVAVVAGLAFWQIERIALVLWQPYERATEMINAEHVEEYLELCESDPEEHDPATYFVDPGADEPILTEEFAVRMEFIETKPGEAFLFGLKSSIYLGILGGSPILIWQLWQFIAAGLYRHERLAITAYVPLSVLLFLGGILFGYFGLVPYALYYFGSFFDFGFVGTTYKVSEYASMMFSLCLVLGAVFQLPVVMLLFARLGLLDPKVCGKYRGHFAVAAFVIAAILTPPDPITQIFLAVPMIVLYELGIWLSRFSQRERRLPTDSVTRT